MIDLFFISRIICSVLIFVNFAIAIISMKRNRYSGLVYMARLTSILMFGFIISLGVNSSFYTIVYGILIILSIFVVAAELNAYYEEIEFEEQWEIEQEV